MSSPMKAPTLHDTLVLLDGAKRYVLPGVARVSAGLAANQDVQQPPADKTKVVSLNDATADISVQLVMWTDEQWLAYKNLLGVFRKGKVVFTSAHPELRARGVKRLYFVSEQGEAYSPGTGYKTTLRFSEHLKTPAPVQETGDVSGAVGADADTPPTGSDPGTATGGASTAAGQRLKDAALRVMVQNPPPKSANGFNDVSEGGYCSAFERVVGRAAGLPNSLYGQNALETERLFKSAKMSVPYSSATQSGLEVGDTIFYARDASGQGHAATFIGYAADGTALTISNNLVTYGQRGGQLDSAGRPTGYDDQRRRVDARGVQPMLALGTPTSIGKPYKVGVAKSGPALPPVKAGPPVPLPVNRPSQHIPQPPSAALTPYQQLKVIVKP